METVYYNETLV